MVAPLEDRGPLFALGRLVITPGALEVVGRGGHYAYEFIDRHERGDFGECCAEDWAANEPAIRCCERVFSVYLTNTGEKLWLITEADRSSSCLLLPSEY